METSNIPDKQLRLELYHSVYNPGYCPLPDPPHVWAKHSNALNRVVAKQNTNPRRWSNEEVIKFIQSVPNCKDIGSIFRKHVRTFMRIIFFIIWLNSKSLFLIIFETLKTQKIFHFFFQKIFNF